jgi:hypothetical protein
MMTEWQPIETAPKDGTRILFLAYGDTVYLGQWSDHWGSFEPEYSEVPMFNEPDDDRDVTHWMPLPLPPSKHDREGI